jgi:adenine-specific DNA-methyltransferase
LPKKYDYSGWSKEDLINRVHELEKRKKYGLVWDEEREPEQVVLQCKKELPVLKEAKEKEIKNDPDKPTHILIEGDNYHALSVLNYTHENSVDVIYIDPPYNTGARDWKYNNNFIDENDAYRHSKWLTFMNNRLKVAKNLLKPKGLLICAVDENEQERLGLLLEDIFPSHQKTCVTIIHNPGGIQGDNFSYSHEYAYFIYPKGKRYINLQDRDENPDIRPLRDVSKGNHLRESAKNCFYPIFVKDNEIIGFGDVSDESFHPESINVYRDDGILEIYPIDPNGNERKWVFARQSVEEIKDELSVQYNNRRKIWDIIRNKTHFNYKTVWVDKKYNSNIFGSKILNQILDKEFPFPKSLWNVKECLDAAVRNNKNAIILDYFAGSGTTGHAVLEMNRIDSGNRKFILCTNNENNICDEVCLPRIRKIIKGYRANSKTRSLLIDKKISFRDLSNIDMLLKNIDKEKLKNQNIFEKYEIEFEDNTIKLFGVNKKGSFIDGFSGNLKYYQTDFVPAESTDENKEKLTKQSVEMLCLRENTFDLVSEEALIKIFRSKEKYTAILFDQLEIPKLKETIKKFDKPVHVYIFSLGDDNFADEFFDMKNSVTVKSIPAAILRVYRRIFK